MSVTWLAMNREETHITNSSRTAAISQRALGIAIHDLAQPLCALQGILEMASLSAAHVSDYRSAVAASLTEIARVHELLSFLKAVVQASDMTVDAGCAIAPASILEDAVEDHRRAVGDRRITVLVNCEHPIPDVVGPESGMRQALFCLLTAADSHLDRGSVIEVQLNLCGSFVEMNLKGVPSGSSHGWRVNKNLLLAETIVVRCGGRLDFQMSPFIIKALFPAVNNNIDC